MKHVPQYAFFLAVGALLAAAFAERSSAPPGRNRLALSLTMESGHVRVQAELGAALIALGI